MAIQHRRGQYADFDPSKMLQGEAAVVISGDPNVSDGKSAYIAFGPGNVKRLATMDDIQYDLQNATDEAVEEATQRAEAAARSVESSATQITQNATNISNLQSSKADKSNTYTKQEVDNALDESLGELAGNGFTGMLARNKVIDPLFEDISNLITTGTFVAQEPYSKNGVLHLTFDRLSSVSIPVTPIESGHVIFVNFRAVVEQRGSSSIGVALKNESSGALNMGSVGDGLSASSFTSNAVDRITLNMGSTSNPAYKITVKSPIVIDLTEIFGSGKEPDREIFAQYFNAYYDADKFDEGTPLLNLTGLFEKKPALLVTNRWINNALSTAQWSSTEFTVTGNGSSTYLKPGGIMANSGMSGDDVINSNCLVYCAGWVKVTGNPTQLRVEYGKRNMRNTIAQTDVYENIENDTWIRISALVTPSSARKYFEIYADYDSTEAQSNGTLTYKKGMVINLTYDMGKWNEITDKEVIDNLLLAYPDSWFSGTKNLLTDTGLGSLFTKRHTLADGSSYGLDGNGVFYASSIIDITNDDWTHNQYTYGLDKRYTKLPHQFDGGIETNGMYTVMLPKYARWERGAVGLNTGSLFGGHVFEAWNNIGTYRLTAMMGHGGDKISYIDGEGQTAETAREDEACIIVYSPGGSFNNPLVEPSELQARARIQISRDDYYYGTNPSNFMGRIRIGSDTPTEGVVFTRNKMISYNHIILADKTQENKGKRLKFNNDGTVTWEEVDLYGNYVQTE